MKGCKTISSYSATLYRMIKATNTNGINIQKHKAFTFYLNSAQQNRQIHVTFEVKESLITARKTRQWELLTEWKCTDLKTVLQDKGKTEEEQADLSPCSHRTSRNSDVIASLLQWFRIVSYNRSQRAMPLFKVKINRCFFFFCNNYSKQNCSSWVCESVWLSFYTLADRMPFLIR